MVKYNKELNDFIVYLDEKLKNGKNPKEIRFDHIDSLILIQI